MTIVERLFPRAPQPVTTASVPGAVPPSTPSPRPDAPVDPQVVELELRRADLAAELAQRQWDLGGLTYEMAIRDHFRMDVLTKLAAELQERDAQLAEVERLLKLDAGGAAGECPSCRAPHSRGAVYCWSCGHQLMPTSTQAAA